MTRPRLPDRVAFPCPVELLVLDTGDDEGRLTFAAWPCDPTRPWRGCSVYQSPDSRTGFRPVFQIETPATVGRVARWPEVRWPEDGPTLESVDDAGAQAGRNTFLVGRQVVQVTTWELVGRTAQRERVYRGLGYPGDMAARRGDLVLWLDGGGVERRSVISPLNLRVSRYWRAVPAGESVVRAETVEVVRLVIPSRAGRASP